MSRKSTTKFNKNRFFLKNFDFSNILVLISTLSEFFSKISKRQNCKSRFFQKMEHQNALIFLQERSYA